MQDRIPEKLSEFIREESKKLGFHVVDISTRVGKTFFLEIVLDKEGGITMEECGNFNRKVSARLEQEKTFGARYTLDVCSPGLDRPLKKDADYLWAVGRQVEIHLVNPVNSKSIFTGKLKKVNDAETIAIEDTDGSEVSIERNNIAKSNLWESI